MEPPLLAVQIEELTESDFTGFLEVLNERSPVSRDFYLWKYKRQPGLERPNGFIAHLGTTPMACVGMVQRTLVLADGSELKVNWFADLFTIERYRGQGLAQRMLEGVRCSAPAAMGAPGPAAAQWVAQRAGFSVINSVQECTTYLNPFAQGYHVQNMTWIKRVLRGTKFLLKFSNKTLDNLPPIMAERWHNGLPETKIWQEAGARAFRNKSHLKRDRVFLDWIGRMPSEPEQHRKWWYVTGDGVFACGYTEKRADGSVSAKILDVLTEGGVNFGNTLGRILVLLRNKKIHSARFCFDKSLVNLPFIHRKVPTPLHVTDPVLMSGIFLTTLDKENSWRDI